MSILVLKITIFLVSIISFKLGKYSKTNRSNYTISGISSLVLFCVIQSIYFTSFSIANILLLLTSVIIIFTKGNKELQAQYTLPFILFTLVAYEIAIFL